MCLITNQKKPLIAEQDIAVVKTLLSYNNSENVYSTIQHFEYILNKLYETEILESSLWKYADDQDKIIVNNKYPDYDRDREIHKSLIDDKTRTLWCYGTGFHSFFANRLPHYENQLNSVTRVHHCTIPAGSLFYKGIDSSLLISNQIIINNAF